jgi:hypothetical protein
MHIRATVKSADGSFGPVVTNSYFIGKTASYYKNLRVISMVTDPNLLFHRDTGAYMVGARYYEWKKSSDFVKLDNGDVQNKTNYNFDGRESEFPVNIQVFENGTAVYSSDAFAGLIISIVESWAKKPDAEDIAVILNTQDLNKLEETLLAVLKEKMLKGITLKANDNFDGGFRIAVNNGSAYYDYSAEAVVDMLSNYLSPKVTELLKEAKE